MIRIINIVCFLLCALNLHSQSLVVSAAENGDLDAQKWLADRYYEGDNMSYPRNYQLSYKWNLAAARQGDSESQYKLFLIKEYTPSFQSEDDAFAWGVRAADQGHSFAAFLIGTQFMRKNDNRALKYFQIAGPVANIQIGLCYLKGLGTPKDVNKAKKTFLEVIETLKDNANTDNELAYQSVAEAYRLMALIFLQEDDENNALKYALTLGDFGVAEGYTIASEILLSHGDKENAVKALQKGVKLGDSDCMAKMGKLAYASGQIKTAINFYGDALEADEHCESALERIGWCYYELKDYIKAKEFFAKAIDEGLSSGYNQMAYLYANGFGVRQDFIEAHRLVDIALSIVEIESDDYVNYLDSKGEFYIIEGNEAEAKNVWNQMITLDKRCETWTTAFAKHMHGIARESIDDIGNIVALNDNINTFVVAIGNENYKYEENVPFANNDVKTFAEYCHRILGVPSANIKVVEDAGYNDMRYVISWLNKVISVYEEDAKVIFYYAGHGIPNVSNKSSYLLPVDGYGGDTATGYSLSDLYASLGTLSAKSVSVFLDACFSGATRDGKILDAARGVAIKVNRSFPTGNMVVFSASQSDETAYPYENQRHGLFTYFLLKKLQETKGEISLNELTSYVIENVTKKSIVVNGKIQTPNVNPSASLGESWKIWTLK